MRANPYFHQQNPMRVESSRGEKFAISTHNSFFSPYFVVKYKPYIVKK